MKTAMEVVTNKTSHHQPWNKGKIVGQKAPLKLKEIWAIRVRLLTHDPQAQVRPVSAPFRQARSPTTE
jgi:hypothetical protein